MSIPGPWKQVYKAAELLKMIGVDLQLMSKGVLGSGSRIRFWTDIWVGSEPLYSVYPDIFRLEKNKSCAVADRVTMLNGVAEWAWDWTREPESDEEVSQLLQLTTNRIPPHLTLSNDGWVWSIGKMGIFTVSSIKSRIIELHNARPMYVLAENNWVPKKVWVLAWRLIQNRLPTRDALVRRNIQVQDAMCPICNETLETTEHCFVGCGFAQTIWALVSQWCKIPPVYAFDIKDLVDLHKHYGGSVKQKKLLYGVILVALWCIWKTRNEAAFKNIPGSTQKSLGEIKARSFLWLKARSKIQATDWKTWNAFEVNKIIG